MASTLTAGSRGRGQWCCLGLWGGWSRRTDSSGWAKCVAAATTATKQSSAFKNTFMTEWVKREEKWIVSLVTRTFESMTSFSRFKSSIAWSQFCIRISEASFPHNALMYFLSVGGSCNIKIRVPYLAGVKVCKQNFLKYAPTLERSTSTRQLLSSFRTHTGIWRSDRACRSCLPWTENKRERKFTYM